MMEQRLSLIRLTGAKTADGHLEALYRCQCGNEVIVARSRVRNGYTRSCGCLVHENAKTHGGRNSATYASWRSMRERCLNPSSKDYARWGGRGITVCERWNDFAAFREDMGHRPNGATLDRIDPDGNYEPGNCRWATPREQARNRRDLVVVRTADGEMPLVDYAAQLGISKGAAHLRLKRGKLEGATRV